MADAAFVEISGWVPKMGRRHIMGVREVFYNAALITGEYGH